MSTFRTDQDYWVIENKETGEIFKSGLRDIDGDGKPEAVFITQDAEDGSPPLVFCAPLILKENVSVKKNISIEKNGEEVVRISADANEGKSEFGNGLKANIGTAHVFQANEVQKENVRSEYTKTYKSKGVPLGNAGEFFNFLEDNDDPSVVISTAGQGPSAVAQVTNPINTAPALLGFHTGAGPAICWCNKWKR